MAPTRRPLLLLAVVSGLAVVLAAAFWVHRRWVTPDHPPAGPSAVIAGDSVTVLSAEELGRRVRDHELRIVAQIGNRTEETLAMLEAETDLDEPGPEDRLVVLLGYNDIRGDPGHRSVDELLDWADGYRCVVWFRLPAVPWGIGDEARSVAAETGPWNAHLEEVAAQRPHLRVSSRWAEAVEAEPDRLLDQDQVHPSDAGSEALAEAVAAELEEGCP